MSIERFYVWMLAAAASFAIPFGAARSQDLSDNEFESDTAYYEEDKWYDITEWFDGNDYNPTDERWYRWDDEKYEASEDTGWDFDSDYDYSDSDADLYDYDADDEWLSNYWGSTYTHFIDTDNDGIYENTYTYYDWDNDGLYDSFYSFSDLDDDGLYDDRPDYQSFGQRDDNRRFHSPQSGATRQQRLTGTVQNTKLVSVGKKQHLIASVQKSDDSRCLVDLGPADALDRSTFRQGSQIEATGLIRTVGEMNVMIAQRVTMNGRATRINRDVQTIRGQVADTRETNVRGEKHTIAILATREQGKTNKTLVDLGPTNDLNLNLRQDAPLEVRGVPVKFQNQTLVMAHTVRQNGREFNIDRVGSQRYRQTRADDNEWNRRDSGRQTRADSAAWSRRDADRSMNRGSEQDATTDRRFQTASGEVLDSRRLTVRGSQRQVATIETDRNQRVLVDLGPALASSPRLREGDQIQARGTFVRARDGRPVLIARSVDVNGVRREIGARTGDQTATGEITDLRMANIRGEQRQLATVETGSGRTIVVDVGPRRQVNLSEGDRITARGVAVQSGDQVILMASEIDVNGETQSIQRQSRTD